MVLLTKSQVKSRGMDTSAYAPTAKALNEIPEADKRSLRVTFDIAQFVATQKLALTDYPVLSA